MVLNWGFYTSSSAEDQWLIWSTHLINSSGYLLSDYAGGTVMGGKHDVDNQGIPRILDCVGKVWTTLHPGVEYLEGNRTDSILAFGPGSSIMEHETKIA